MSGPAAQRATWLAGALVEERLGGSATGDALAVLEHTVHLGYNSPMHRHADDDVTFVVIDGHVELTIDGELHVAGAGSAFWLARRSVHGFVVASPRARFLTLHSPAGSARFVTEAGTPALIVDGERESHQPDTVVQRSPDRLAKIAAKYGIEIVGPPPTLRA
jgi:quercetin dioxygenase-like cupin family protein